MVIVSLSKVAVYCGGEDAEPEPVEIVKLVKVEPPSVEHFK
jgi:hypothetical protein